MATPKPLTTAAATVAPYVSAHPMPHMPTPAKSTPSAINHGHGRLSLTQPNKGWITAETIFAPNTSITAWV